MDRGSRLADGIGEPGKADLEPRIADLEPRSANYPGLFSFGSTEALADLLQRVEAEEGFLRELARRCRARRAIASPAREKAAWKGLLGELW